MPVYSIQGPDGKTYSIDGPEGASREQVIDAIQAKMAAPQAAPETTALTSAIHGAERGLLPTIAGLTVGAGGAAVGSLAGPVGAIAGGVGAGMAAANETAQLQAEFLKSHPKIAETLGLGESQQEKEEKEHPYASMAGELAPSVLAFRPSGTLLRSAEGLTEEGAKLLKAQKTAAVVNSGINAAVMGGMEAGQEAMGEGPMDPTKIAIAAGAGALGQKETALGRGLMKLGEMPLPASVRASAEALRRPEIKPTTPETPIPETQAPIPTTEPISGALDASHFNEEDLATVKSPQEKLNEEINRVAEGKNPEPTPEELQAKKAAEDLQAQQEAAMKIPKAETTIKPTDIVTEEGVKLNEPTDTTLISKKDVETLGKESKKALEQNIAEQKAATEIPKAPKAAPTKGIQAALKESGGINTEHLEDLTGEKTVNKSGATVGLFTKEGKGLDDAVHVAVDKGYLNADVLHDVDGGVQALRDLIQDEIHGKKAVPLEAQGNAELEAYLAREEQKRAMEEIKLSEEDKMRTLEAYPEGTTIEQARAKPRETIGEFLARATPEELEAFRQKNRALDMSDEGRRIRAEEEANKRLAETAAEEQGKVYYSKGAVEGGISKEQFFDRVLRDFGPSVGSIFKRGIADVHGDISEVPPELHKYFGENTKGISVPVNGTRKAVFITNRITPAEVRGIVLHEVGEHYGLRGMLGEDVYKQVLNTVENLKNKDDLVKKAYDEAMSTPYYKGLYDSGRKDIFYSEVIAKLGEDAPNHGFWKRITQAIKTFLIKKGIVKDISGKELQDLVMHSLRKSMDETQPIYGLKGEVLKSERPGDPAEAKRIKEELEAMGAPKTTPHGNKTMEEFFSDTKDMMKESIEAFKGRTAKENFDKTRKLGSKYGTEFRNAFMDYNAGLQEADARRYNRSTVKANGEAISTVAATNALHSNHILAQVMLDGRLEFNNETKQFNAVKGKYSVANILNLEKALQDKLGKTVGSDLVQTYTIAKRSRSIQNTYEMTHGKLLELKEGITDVESLAKNNPDALAAKLNQLDVLTPEDYARMKQNPNTLSKKLMKVYEIARADAEKEFSEIIKAYTSIPDSFCLLTHDGKRRVQKVLTKNGTEIAEVPLINDDHIDKAIGQEKANPELREIMDNFTAVNHNMLDNQYYAGLLNERRWKKLKSIKDYVPWFRVDDESEPIHYTAPGGRSLSSIETERKFKQGFVDKDIDNVVSNMEAHTYKMGTNSIRNHAANEIAKDYATRDENGKIKVFPKEGITKDGAVRTNIVIGGQRVIIEIKDPLVASSMLGVHQIDVPMMKYMGGIQQGFRRSLTTNPFFQVYQVFKDAPTAAAVTGLKSPLKVYAKVFSGFARALRKDDEIVNILKSHGIGGFRFAGRTAEKEFNIQMGVRQHKFTSSILAFLDHIGDASDYAQRIAIYDETLKQTGSKTQALYNANSIIDFMKRGNSQAAQFEIRTVSFMNAFMQQMDVLLQGMAGGGIKGMSRQQAFNRFWTATGAFATMTLAYCMLKGNDPDYQKLDDETKNRNFVFGKFKIPCSTSYSLLYKSIIENAYNYITSQATASPMDLQRLQTTMYKALQDAALGPNPIPTALRPPLEIITNHDFFTGGNVVPQSVAKLDPFMQYTNTTSELGKTISHLSGGALNPIQVDHLMRGILGTVATSTMWISDVFTSNKPEKVWSQNPLVGSFFLPPEGHGPESLFYDLKERTDAKYNTFMKLAERQHPEEMKKYLKENKGLIAAHDYTTSVAAQLQNITREIQRISDVPSTVMSADKKRDLITKYQQIQNQMLKTVPKIRKDVAGL